MFVAKSTNICFWNVPRHQAITSARLIFGCIPTMAKMSGVIIGGNGLDTARFAAMKPSRDLASLNHDHPHPPPHLWTFRRFCPGHAGYGNHGDGSAGKQEGGGMTTLVTDKTWVYSHLSPNCKAKCPECKKAAKAAQIRWTQDSGEMGRVICGNCDFDEWRPIK